MIQARHVNRKSVLFGFHLFFSAFLIQSGAGEEFIMKRKTLDQLCQSVKENLDPEDYTKGKDVVSGIRIYYNLCGVDQMVTVIGSQAKGEKSITYTLEVASANIPGPDNAGVVVNRRPLKLADLKTLFDHIETKEIYDLPERLDEKNPVTGAMIFTERWNKQRAHRKLIIRDFYESRVLDELMIIMYQLAWNPSP